MPGKMISFDFYVKSILYYITGVSTADANHSSLSSTEAKNTRKSTQTYKSQRTVKQTVKEHYRNYTYNNRKTVDS